MTPPDRPDCTMAPEAADLPEGVTTLADALRELADILPGLKAAIERKPPVERLAYRIDEVADSLGMSRRAIEREQSAGRFPAPTRTSARSPSGGPTRFTIGSMPEKGDGYENVPY